LLAAAPAGARPQVIDYENTVVSHPRGVDFRVGTLYVADTNHHRVLGVENAGEPDQRVTVVAGSSTPVEPTSCGKRDPAGSSLCLPPSVAVSAGGGAFIADTFDHRILRVDQSGDASTVAGTPGQAATGDEIGDGGPADRAQLATPWGVALDGDAYYISERDAGRIRFVDEAAIIHTIAGGGSAVPADGDVATDIQLLSPLALAHDPAHHQLYVVEEGWNAVLRVELGAVPPTVTVIAGTPGLRGFAGDGGPATQALLDQPRGLALDGCSLYVGDSGNHRVRRVDLCALPPVISTVAGTGTPSFNGDGPATATDLDAPEGLATGPTGSVYIADRDNCRVRLLDEGEIRTVFGRSCDENPDPGTLHFATPSPGYGVAFAKTPFIPVDATRDYMISLKLFVPRTSALYPHLALPAPTDLRANHWLGVWMAGFTLLLDRGYELVNWLGGDDYEDVGDLGNKTDRWVRIDIRARPSLGYYTVAIDGRLRPDRFHPRGGFGTMRATLGDTRADCLSIPCAKAVARGDDQPYTHHGEAYFDDIVVSQDGHAVFSASFDGRRCLEGWDYASDPATSLTRCSNPPP
jgi:hypothetical protein